MTPEQREQFVEALYQILTAKDALTLSDLLSLKKENLFKKGTAIDPQVRTTIQKTLAVLVELNAKSVIEDIFPAKKSK